MVGGVDAREGGLFCLAPGKTVTMPVAMEPVLSAPPHDLITMKRKTSVEKVKGLSNRECFNFICIYESESE